MRACWPTIVVGGKQCISSSLPARARRVPLYTVDGGRHRSRRRLESTRFAIFVSEDADAFVPAVAGADLAPGHRDALPPSVLHNRGFSEAAPSGRGREA